MKKIGKKIFRSLWTYFLEMIILRLIFLIFELNMKKDCISIHQNKKTQARGVFKNK